MSLVSILAEMRQYPPDPNGPVPISNRPATMYGAVIPFHIIAFIAVLSRLYTRFIVLHEPGWDDAFIILASLSNIAGMVGYIGGIKNGGMGNHLVNLTQEKFTTTMVWLYVVGGAYALTTTLVKVSLLCQYLRLFRAGKLRIACYILLILVSLWGVAYCFVSFVPCFPVRGFWDRTLTTAKCYGLGFGDLEDTKANFILFAATNMFFDVCIFFVPMVEYFKIGLGRKQVLALTGLFTLGTVVIIMAILRLWVTVRNEKAPLVETIDFTWWYPLTLIISCIELDFAIICASMPIFWPNMVAHLAQIFVTNEVHITHHFRLEDGEYNPRGGNYEMDVSKDWKFNTSQEKLTLTPSQPNSAQTNYSGHYVVGHVTGKVQESTQIRVGPVQ